MDQYGEKVKQILDKIIAENPEHSNMAETMKKRLIECGWKDEVKLECSNIIAKRGVDNSNVDDIVKEVTPIARAKVPTELKKELVAMLKDALMKELEKHPDTKP